MSADAGGHLLDLHGPILLPSLDSFPVCSSSHTAHHQRQRKKMRALMNECRLTPIIWNGWVRAISSHRLLPGDVMVLQPGKALCDMVVLQGSCLLVESMLSGEI